MSVNCASQGIDQKVRFMSKMKSSNLLSTKENMKKQRLLLHIDVDDKCSRCDLQSKE